MHKHTKVANIAQFIQSFKSNYSVRFSRKAIENVCETMMGFYGDVEDGLHYFEDWGQEPMSHLEAIFGLYVITKRDLDLGRTPYIVEVEEAYGEPHVDSMDRECIRDAVLQARGVEATDNLVDVEQIRKFRKLKECPTFMAEWRAAGDEGGPNGASAYVDSRLPRPSHFNLFNNN